jgi:hypothetical protein
MAPISSNGSTFIYHRFIKPFVVKHQSEIDEALSEAKSVASDAANKAMDQGIYLVAWLKKFEVVPDLSALLYMLTTRLYIIIIVKSKEPFNKYLLAVVTAKNEAINQYMKQQQDENQEEEDKKDM